MICALPFLGICGTDQHRGAVEIMVECFFFHLLLSFVKDLKHMHKCAVVLTVEV